MYKVSHCLMYYLGLTLEEVIFLIIQLSFMIASSVHEWIWRFKFICLYSIEVWFLPSLINVLRYNLLIRDFVKKNLSQTLTDNLYWLWFFYFKDTVQTLRSDKFAMINLFHTTDLFQSPLRTSENQIFSDYLRGYRNRPVAWNGLIAVQIFSKSFSKDYQFIKKTSNFVSGFLSLKSGIYGYRMNCF